MTQPTPDAIAIDPSQLTLGLYVWLDLAILQSLPLAGKLHYVASKSTAEPLSFGDTQVPDVQEMDSLALAHQKLANARQEKIRHVKDAAARTRAASVTAVARHGSGHCTCPQALLHLLGTKEDHGPQFHALNVMTLCMLVGHKVGLSERDLTNLAMAALAHDAWQGRHTVVHLQERPPEEARRRPLRVARQTQCATGPRVQGIQRYGHCHDCRSPRSSTAPTCPKQTPPCWTCQKSTT